MLQTLNPLVWLSNARLLGFEYITLLLVLISAAVLVMLSAWQTGELAAHFAGLVGAVAAVSLVTGTLCAVFWTSFSFLLSLALFRKAPVDS